jgi:5-dehydro-2-deoxygluconokinase
VSASPDVLLLGRVSVDFPPDGVGVPLEAVRAFRRTIGGYGGNVGTGLARLGVSVAVVATVGDDGHGRFARGYLAREGVDTTALRSEPAHRTPLAFYEAWPPDRFPVTFYPSPAYWAIEGAQVSPVLVAAPLLVVSVTSLAQEPSRSVALDLLAARRPGRTIVLDLDWRPVLWSDPGAAAAIVGRALGSVDVVIGSESEFEALGLTAREVAGSDRRVYLKRGELGARFLDASTEHDVAAISVEAVCGLGAGDAFAASVGEGIVRDRDAATILRRANAAGAIATTRIETSDSMPTSAEIDELLASVAAEAVSR